MACVGVVLVCHFLQQLVVRFVASLEALQPLAKRQIDGDGGSLVCLFVHGVLHGLQLHNGYASSR